DTLEQALPEVLLARSGLPVVDADDQQVVGWLTQSDVLRAYHRRISGQPAPPIAGMRPRGSRATV
ncbi:MAG TPA: CBS domain-containing protein, partial [Gaiellaceae bacterium]|nr:CBS domain-containing protein [Gaiellaceae bacterium]